MKFLLLFVFFSCFLHSEEMSVKNKVSSENIISSKDTKLEDNKMLSKGKNECDKKSKCDKRRGKITFAFKPAYFWPQEKVRYRGIYKGGFIPLIETCYIAKNGLGPFLEVGYFRKKAHKTSVDVRARTKVVQVPLSLGLKYTFCITSCLDFYIKMGPNWLYTKTDVNIPGLKRTITKNTFGGTFGLGSKIYIFKYLFLELFTNYLYDKKKNHDRDSGETFRVYLGGIQAGGGLGFSF